MKWKIGYRGRRNRRLRLRGVTEASGRYSKYSSTIHPPTTHPSLSTSALTYPSYPQGPHHHLPQLDRLTFTHLSVHGEPWLAIRLHDALA